MIFFQSATYNFVAAVKLLVLISAIVCHISVHFKFSSCEIVNGSGIVPYSGFFLTVSKTVVTPQGERNFGNCSVH